MTLFLAACESRSDFAKSILASICNSVHSNNIWYCCVGWILCCCQVPLNPEVIPSFAEASAAEELCLLVWIADPITLKYLIWDSGTIVISST